MKVRRVCFRAKLRHITEMIILKETPQLTDLTLWLHRGNALPQDLFKSYLWFAELHNVR